MSARLAVDANRHLALLLQVVLLDEVKALLQHPPRQIRASAVRLVPAVGAAPNPTQDVDALTHMLVPADLRRVVERQ